MRIPTLIALVAASAAMAGCNNFGFGGLPDYVHPKHVVVLTEGVRIIGKPGAHLDADGKGVTHPGGWRLEGSDPQTPPFLSAYKRVLIRGKLYDPEGRVTSKRAEDLLEPGHAVLARQGARHVTVYVPGRKKPLNGVIAFSPVAANTKDRGAKRVYTIRVPASRVEQATGGRVAVIYQPYHHPDRGGIGDWGWGGDAQGIAWILWLTDGLF